MRVNIQKGITKDDTFLSVTKTNQSKKDKLFTSANAIIVTCIIYVTLLLSLLSMFHFKAVSFLTMIPGVLLISYMCFYSLINQKLRTILNVLFILLLSGFFILQNEWIMNGFFLSVNQVSKIIGTHMGTIIPKYKVTLGEENYTHAINFIWIYFAFFVAAITYFIVYYYKSNFYWIILLLVFTFQVYSNVYASLVLNVLLFISGVIVTNYSFIHKQKGNKILLGRSKNSVTMTSSLFIVILVSFSFLIISFVKPSDTYSKVSLISNTKNAVTQYIEDFRYEKDKTNTFTQGDFTKLKELELLEEPALEVIMDQPTSLYLRGFVGSSYTSERWIDLDHEVYYDEQGLFYWLNKEGFDELNQLNLVNEVSNPDKKTNDDLVQITVNNINANSKYLYTPYELITKIKDFDNIDSFNQETVKSNSFFGNRIYNYESNSNLVKNYPTIASNLYAQNDDKATETFLKNESHYNKFVYDQYTKVNKELNTLFDNHLEIELNESEDHIPYEQAIDLVRTYLQRNINYRINPDSLPEGRDFIAHLLESSKEGYATHFATAGTMMFRYLGIPSRYVEGYLITPMDIEELESFEKLNVQGTNAHAWTEVYFDELGWIPIEVTPPYFNVMEQTDISNYPKGDTEAIDDSLLAEGTTGGSSKSDKEVVEKDEIKDPKQQDHPDKQLLINKIYWLVTGLIVVLIIAYVVYLTIKRIQLSKLKKSFNDPNIKHVIPRIFAYTMSLLHYNGLPEKSGSIFQYVDELKYGYSEEYVNKFKEVVKINQQSIYSNSEMSIDEYNKMYDFMNETIIKIKDSKNIFQRIKMKFHDFIY